MTAGPLQPLLADSGIIPVVIFWVVMALVARAAKNKKQQQASRSEGAPEQPPSRSAGLAGDSGLLGQLKQAMEELKRAEQQTTSPRPQAKAPEARARDYLQQQKKKAAAKRAVAQPAKRQVLEVANDESSEGESLEGSDYDNDAERLILARREAAERRGRDDVSVEGLSVEQQARRASRPDVTIGTASEHNAWHDEIGAQPAVTAVKKRTVLQRYGDGSAKGAMVLSMILGPTDIQQDG